MSGLIEKYVDNNLWGDNNPIHVNSNINIDNKAKFNPDKKITGNNSHEKNSKINIEDLF